MTKTNLEKWLFVSSLICVMIAYVFMYYNLVQVMCSVMIFAIGLFLVSLGVGNNE